jgi:hypothetical protein
MLTKLDIANQIFENATFDINDAKSVKKFNDEITKAISIYTSLCMDFDAPIKMRAESLNMLFYNVQEEGVEILSRYRDMLGIDDSKKVRDVVEILKLSMESVNIPVHEKIVTLNIMRSRGYIDVYPYFINVGYLKDATLLQKAEVCKFLYASGNDEFIESAKKSLSDFIQDSKFSSNERYSLIREYVMVGENNCIKSIYLNKSLISGYETDEAFITPLYKSFFFNDQINEIRDRLLAGRALLTMESLSSEDRLSINKEILNIAQNKNLVENQRGDACDSLLRLGLPEYVIQAKAILSEIGFTETQRRANDLLKRAKILYNDSQNAHQVSDESLNVFAEKVASDGMAFSFEDANNYTLNLIQKIESPEEKLKIRSSLRQISQDVTTFTSYKMTCAEVFTYVVGKIKNLSSEDVNKELLEKLLLDELVAMDETCPSGHAIRFVLVLAIVDNSIRISFDKQIASNFAARINVHFLQLSDEEKDAICCALGGLAEESEMEIFKRFKEKYVPLVRKELESEFVPTFVSLEEFDKAFKEGSKDYA